MVILCVCFFTAYLIPPVYSYCHRNYFAYVNAWDEETYLSYQSAVNSMRTPGYFFSSTFVFLMHEMGISGGAQNLLLDVIVPLAILFLATAAFSHFGIGKSKALFYSLILVFGSVLFNRANPAINSIVSRDLPHLVSALENYPSILRSPNPQLSYLLIVICSYLAIRRRSVLFLWIPLPFMYWSVAIPYAFAIVAYSVYRRLRPKRYYQFLILNIAVGLILGGLSYGLLTVVLRISPGFLPNVFAEEFHSPMCSVTLLASLFLYGIAWFTGLVTQQRMKRDFHFVYIMLISCLLFIVNLQVFTRVRLDPKNLQDSSGVFIASAILALTIHLVFDMARRGLSRKVFVGLSVFGKYATLIVILCLVLITQGFSFSQFRYKIFLNFEISKAQLSRIKQDPLHAIIPWDMVSAKMTLIAPKISAPPFSYQYRFVNKTCSLNESLMRRAYDYVKAHVAENEALQEAYSHITRNVELYFETVNETKNTPYKNNKRVCAEGDYSGDDFYIVNLDDESYWGFFLIGSCMATPRVLETAPFEH